MTYEVVVKQANYYVLVVEARDSNEAETEALLQFGRAWKRQELAPSTRGLPKVVEVDAH